MRARQGFTLIEVLISFLILSVGFSAIYYWFLTQSQMTRRDQIRNKANFILQSEAEYLTAYPNEAKDSSWSLADGNDSFTVIQKTTDTLLVQNDRPREVHLRIQTEGTVTPYSFELFLVVGGLSNAP